jgi:hypothetical protein
MITAITASERRKRLKLKHIVASEQNYLALKKLGHARDSFNDGMSKLLRIHRNCQEKQQQLQGQQESDDDNSSNSSNSGLLFPPSFSEMLDEQNRQQMPT